MNIGIYKKAKKINAEIDEYRKLRSICNCAYKRHILTKKFYGCLPTIKTKWFYAIMN